MTEFTVFYELGGHKMRTTVQAKSRNEAEAIVRSKVIIHKIEPKISLPPEFDVLFPKFK